MSKASLSDWLKKIESQHPLEIELGLDRIRTVAARMGALDLSMPLISVAGTNGKGSTVSFLTALYTEAGFQVGAYTSPHIMRFNERITVNGVMVEDESIIQAFEAIEAARAQITLSYFEYATLAAVWVFLEQGVDVIVLEVGLGGRLDAVNIWDADVAIVTSIAVDHESWLGSTRELIAPEKVGIARKDKPLIVGESDIPVTLLSSALAIGAKLNCINRDFVYSQGDDVWQLCIDGYCLDDLEPLAMVGEHQYSNASVAIVAVKALDEYLPVSEDVIRLAVGKATALARFEQHRIDGHAVVVDVGHNPAAIKALVSSLEQRSMQSLHVVLGVMEDKSVDEMIAQLSPFVRSWYLGDLDNSRAMTTAVLAEHIESSGNNQPIIMHDSIQHAFRQALDDASSEDTILVCGSFFTVADVMECLH